MWVLHFRIVRVRSEETLARAESPANRRTSRASRNFRARFAIPGAERSASSCRAITSLPSRFARLPPRQRRTAGTAGRSCGASPSSTARRLEHHPTEARGMNPKDVIDRLQARVDAQMGRGTVAHRVHAGRTETAARSRAPRLRRRHDHRSMGSLRRRAPRNCRDPVRPRDPRRRVRRCAHGAGTWPQLWRFAEARDSAR